MPDDKLTASEWAREMARRRSESLTAKRRKEIAKKAAQARWGKKERGEKDNKK